MNKRVIATFVAVLLLIGGGYFGSPYWAVRQFKAAAVSGDVDGLNATVDFPAVRESLKGQLTAALTAKMQNDPDMRGNPFAGLGAMMMPAMVGHMVDGMVTADGIAAMVKQGQVRSRGAAAAPAVPNVTYSYGYRGLDHFAATARTPNVQPQDAPAFIFERRGTFSWKLIRIEIPPSTFAQ